MRHRLLVAVLVITGLVVGFWYGPSLVIKTQAVESWTATAATISSVHIEFDSSGSGVDRDSDYTVAVHYRYEVDGQEYLGSRYQVSRALKLDSLAAAEAEVARLQRLSTLEVFFDPENPSDSVMKQGGALHAWLTCVFGWVLLGVGVHFSRRKARMPQGQQEAA